ncbi:hypothetical protein [Saccharopolyspora spinosa]|uniref:hypothetical protein n=1 Tax=Saccharopolyspora spinosa TaxID=60894 RepID=UPI00376F2E3D
MAGVDGVDVPGNRPLGVNASQTPDSLAVTPNVSGVPANAALAETVSSESVVDSDGRVVFPEHGSSVDGLIGRDGDSGVDSVAGRGDSHRLGVAAVSADSVTRSAEGSQVASYPHQDPAAAVPVGVSAGVPVGVSAAVPVGVSVDAVRVLVPGDVVAGGGLVEFVRGGVADSGVGLCCWCLRVIRVRVWWCRRVRVRLWRGVWGGMLLRWCRGRVGVGRSGRCSVRMVRRGRWVGPVAWCRRAWGYGWSGGFVGCGCGLWSEDGGRGRDTGCPGDVCPGGVWPGGVCPGGVWPGGVWSGGVWPGGVGGRGRAARGDGQLCHGQVAGYRWDAGAAVVGVGSAS